MSTTESTIRPGNEKTMNEQAGRSGGSTEAKPVEVEVLVEEISIDGMCGVY